MSHDSEPSPDDIQFALQEVRTLLLQQILATETGLLSVAELVYRNRDEDDIGEENIRYHLREMVDRGIVSKEKVPSGQRIRDLPNTFFGVTDYGETILERANLLAECDLWAELYEQMERTDEIDRIERLKRQDWEQDDDCPADDLDSMRRLLGLTLPSLPVSVVDQGLTHTRVLSEVPHATTVGEDQNGLHRYPFVSEPGDDTPVAITREETTSEADEVH
jgi:hypothetical protein